jgi:hypothetical protein
LLAQEGTKRFIANRAGTVPWGYSKNRMMKALKSDMSLKGLWKDITTRPTRESILARISPDVKKESGHADDVLAARAELLARGMGVYDPSRGSAFKKADKVPEALEFASDKYDKPKITYRQAQEALKDTPAGQWKYVDSPYSNVVGHTAVMAMKDAKGQIHTKWTDQFDFGPSGGDSELERKMYFEPKDVGTVTAGGGYKIEQPGLNKTLLMRLLADRLLVNRPARVTGGESL